MTRGPKIHDLSISLDLQEGYPLFDEELNGPQTTKHLTHDDEEESTQPE